MSIRAKVVMELRQRTGAGMMECKKFLGYPGVNGDIELAIMEMRKAGQARADKKADRIAAEGVIVIARSADMRTAMMVEVNSETDFVARDEHFTTFASHVANTALHTHTTVVADLLNKVIIPGSTQTIEQARQELVAKL